MEKWRARAERRGVGAREWSEGVGVGVGGGGELQEEETRGEKWSWASRVRQRSPVPGGRPGKEGVEAARGPVTSALREGSEWGELAGRRDRDAGEEWKVADAAGGVSGGWRSLRAARAARRCSALPAPLGSLTLPSAAPLCPPQLRR